MEPSTQQAFDSHISVALDRRRTERLPVHVPVQMVAADGSTVPWGVVCTDLSTGGAGIETQALLNVGEVIELTFVTAEDFSPCYRARVVYRNGNHYGVYFLSSE